MIKVILLIDCASEFDRKLLRGMMRYSKENGSWLFYRMPSELRSSHPHYVSWNPIGTSSPDFHRPEYFGVLSL